MRFISFVMPVFLQKKKTTINHTLSEFVYELLTQAVTTA